MWRLGEMHYDTLMISCYNLTLCDIKTQYDALHMCIDAYVKIDTNFYALVICWRTISQWLFLTHYDAMIIYIDPIWRISDTWHITAPLMIYWRNVTPSSVCRSVRGTISTTSLHYAILSGKSSVFIANEGERKWRYEWYVYISGQILHQCVCALC